MSHQFPLHQADCDSYLKHFSFVKMRFRNMHTVHFALIQASWEKTWFRAEFQIIALSITFAVVTPFHTNFKRYFILIIIASHYLIIFDLHINIFIIIQAPPLFFALCKLSVQFTERLFIYSGNIWNSFTLSCPLGLPTPLPK